MIMSQLFSPLEFPKHPHIVGSSIVIISEHRDGEAFRSLPLSLTVGIPFIPAYNAAVFPSVLTVVKCPPALCHIVCLRHAASERVSYPCERRKTAFFFAHLIRRPEPGVFAANGKVVAI